VREDLLETEAIEMPAIDDAGAEASSARPLPVRREENAELSIWRDEVRTAALAAAGGLVAGAATVAVVRASRGGASRRMAKRSRRRERPVKVVASRSFLVDVHLLSDK
jgi:hypothetical protein